MFEEIQKLKLEERIKIYRSLIEISLSKDFTNTKKYKIAKLEFSFEDVIIITRYAILVYGNYLETKNYYKKFGVTTTPKNIGLIDDMRSERQKYIYDFNEQHGTDKKACQKFASDLNISLNDIKTIAKDYATSYLKIPAEEYHWNNFVRGRKDKRTIKAKMPYTTLFDLLLMFFEEEDIMHIIEYSKVDMNKIRNELSVHLDSYMRYKNSGSKELKQEIVKRLQIYYNIKDKELQLQNKEKKDEQLQQLINTATKTITNSINSDYNAYNDAQYARYLNMPEEVYRKYMKIVEKYNPSLYKEYLMKLESNKETVKRKRQEIGKIVSYYLKYGVEYNGTIRNFDLIDFYALSEYNIKDICSECSQILDKEDYIKMARLRSANSQFINNQVVTQRIFVGELEVGCQKDSKGLPIKGTGRKITKEDMEYMKEVFNKYNIPLGLYKVAFDRLKNGVDIGDIAFIYQTDKKNKKLKKD